MKWNKIGEKYFPAVESKLATVDEGVFQVIEESMPGKTLVGLEKIGDNFRFDFKIYDLGITDILERVKITWSSPLWRSTGKNLGIIFNGVKGTGKTIAAKILSNEMNLPVILINHYFDGLLEFMQSIDFECVVLIDEAEKVFQDTDQEASSSLLRMIDGVYSNSRKLFILTTNQLTINDNLIDRPSRIRYIKEFSDVTELAVNQLIKDKLINKSQTSEVRELISNLTFKTIDIIDSIINEFNIHGNTLSENTFNIPKKQSGISVLMIKAIDQVGDKILTMEDAIEIKNLIDPIKYNILKGDINKEIPAAEIITNEAVNYYNNNKEELEKTFEYDDTISTISFLRFWIKKEKGFNISNTHINLGKLKSWSIQLYKGLCVEWNYDDYYVVDIKENILKLECSDEDDYNKVTTLAIVL